MRVSVAVACAALLSLGASTSDGQREDAENVENGEDGPSCVEDSAGAAELSVLSGQNASGHWLAKVRLLHAAGAAGEGASLPPVQLQMQRSTQIRRGGARAVAIEATLAGSPATRLDGSAANSALLESSFTRCSESKAFCPPPQPCPACPSPQPCPSPCPAPCPACPSLPACPQPPECPSPCPALPPAPRRIPSGYVLKKGFGYYKYHTVPVTWFQAKATCEREGGYLVIINSKEEAELVFSFFKALNLNIRIYNTGIRVGLHDLLYEGHFLTVKGQPIADTGYNEWSPKEPNNAFEGEHCVTLSKELQYNDIRCDWNGTFVCELDEE